MATMSSRSHEVKLSFASIDVNGLQAQVINGVPKRRMFFSWLEKLKFDVIVLQETHSLAKVVMFMV